MSKNTNFSFLFLFLFLFLFSIFLQISFCVATNESYQQDDNNDDSDDVDNGVLSQEAANPSKSFGKTFDNDKNKNDNTNSNTLIRDTISSSTNPIKINNPNIGIPETISSLQSPSQTPTGTTLIESNTASASSSLTSSSTQFPNEFQERPTPKKLGNHQFCFRFLNNTKHDFSEYQYFQYRFQFLYESKNRIQSHSFFTAWNHISVSFIVKDAVGTHFRLYLKGEGELSEGGSGNAYNVLVSYFEKNADCAMLPYPLKWIYVERMYDNPVIEICRKSCNLIGKFDNYPYVDPYKGCLNESPIVINQAIPTFNNDKVDIKKQKRIIKQLNKIILKNQTSIIKIVP